MISPLIISISNISPLLKKIIILFSLLKISTIFSSLFKYSFKLVFQKIFLFFILYAFIFFNYGLILEIDLISGEVLFNQKLKLKEIMSIYFIDNYILFNQVNGKTTIFKQWIFY